MNDDITLDTEEGIEESGSEEELEATEARADSKVLKLKKELEATKLEKQEYLDGWQRAKADYVNALKRFDEEKKANKEQGTVYAAGAFLPALDSLARAEAQGAVPEGFSGVLKQLHEGMNKLGLVQFGEVGEAFNPELHEALGQDETEDSALDETISSVLEQGWKIADRVLRPAKVRVAQFTK